MDLGSAIMSVRKARKIKKIELADKAGLSATALYNIEHNLSFPSKETINKICKAMDIPMVYCVTEDDVPENKREAFRYLFPPLKELLIE